MEHVPVVLCVVTLLARVQYKTSAIQSTVLFAQGCPGAAVGQDGTMRSHGSRKSGLSLVALGMWMTDFQHSTVVFFFFFFLWSCVFVCADRVGARRSNPQGLFFWRTASPCRCMHSFRGPHSRPWTWTVVWTTAALLRLRLPAQPIMVALTAGRPHVSCPSSICVLAPIIQLPPALTAPTPTSMRAAGRSMHS